MKKLEFRIEISSPVERVYSTMIDRDHFKEWVSIFSPNSSFEGSWNKGEKIVYMAPDENGALQGMISTIKENIPYKQIYIQPYGIVENGVEIIEGDMVEGLDQSFDKYLFNQKDKVTELKVEVAVYEELEDYFNETWPQALEKLKSICEIND